MSSFTCFKAAIGLRLPQVPHSHQWMPPSAETSIKKNKKSNPILLTLCFYATLIAGPDSTDEESHNLEKERGKVQKDVFSADNCWEEKFNLVGFPQKFPR